MNERISNDFEKNFSPLTASRADADVCLQDFIEEVNSMSDATEMWVLNTDEMSMYYIHPNKTAIEATADPIGTSPTGGINGFGVTVTVDSDTSPILKDADYLGEFYKQQMMLTAEKNGKRVIAPISATVLTDLGYLGVSGDAIRVPTYHSVGLIWQQMTVRPSSFCVKTFDGLSKVFAIRSDTYMYVPQKEIYEMATASYNTEGQFAGGIITNFGTRGEWKFFDRSVQSTYFGKSVKMTPSIIVSTSDTGDSSIIFHLKWTFNSNSKTSVFLASGKEAVTRKHSGDWSKVRKGFEKDINALKDKFTVFTDRMDELLTTSVNKADVHGLVQKWVENASVGKLSQLGQTKEKEIIDCVNIYIDDYFASVGCPQITAADIAYAIMTVPQSYFKSKGTLSSIQDNTLKTALGEIPYRTKGLGF